MTKSNKKAASKRASERMVVFACTAPEASGVFVSGTFNQWSPEVAPMKAKMDGNWEAKLAVPKGRHEFKFVIDGRWCCDGGCTGDHFCSRCVPDGFGGMNRLLEVE